jgi:methyl-accepting chemotaxis protein
MNKSWTFGQKLAAGYAVMVVFAIVLSVMAAYALRNTVASKDRVIGVNAQILLDAEKLRVAAEKRVASMRGYLITREQRSLESLRSARADYATILARLLSAAESEEQRRLLASVERASEDERQIVDQLIAMARAQARPEAIEAVFEEKLFPARDRHEEHLRSFVALEERLLAEAKQSATDAATAAITTMISMAVAAVLFAVIVAIVLTRSLSRQIGTAVGHVQSSSSELQAAATQQATGAKEQATAMNEISTTISELVATSRQIAESAQRVAQIAEQTASAARHGEGTVEKGQDSVSGIRRQVDLVVTHMLDLGKKSQEIGAVLEIVSELAEQTNILAINATIESAGAGEHGKRFAVVADEIRKLADRVGGATKDIRVLIDEIRAASNTTIMATEDGSKAVQSSAKQFGEVAGNFRRIAELVRSNLDVAREIELSTQQQTTAVEQVNTAILEVAQTARQAESSSTQTLQTANQLSQLSRQLNAILSARAES